MAACFLRFKKIFEDNLSVHEKTKREADKREKKRERKRERKRENKDRKDVKLFLHARSLLR